MTKRLEPLQGGLDYFKRNGAPIVSEATAPGGPLSVIRVSGRDLSVFFSLFRNVKPKDRQIHWVNVADVDRAIVLYFKAPHSFTGEDVLEIQCHGVRAIVDTIIKKCLELGAQQALPGEFSFRAFWNNKISLQEAELLNESFRAEALDPLMATKMLGFSDSKEEEVAERLRSFEEKLFRARGRVESAIDFPEAEEEQRDDLDSAIKVLEELRKECHQLLSYYEIFAQQFHLPRVVIVGQTNAGKSTLFNILCGGSRSLVSSLEGTTRDYIEVVLNVFSTKIKLVDTAGLRFLQTNSGQEQLEKLGMEAGLDLVKNSDLLIWVKRADQESDVFTEQSLSQFSKPMIVVYSHANSDLQSQNLHFDFLENHSDVIRDEIQQALFEKLKKRQDPEECLIISKRQHELLKQVHAKIENSIDALLGERAFEVVAQDLQEAEKLIKKCRGQNLGEEYIGQIFSQFCLGK